MRLLDARALDGELLLVLHGGAAAMFGARAAIAQIHGCGVHLVTSGMMSRIRSSHRIPNETNIEFLSRIAILDTIAGCPSADPPVIVRRRSMMSGDPVFRGTRVAPGPVFSMLADYSAAEIVRIAYPLLSQVAIKTALQ